MTITKEFDVYISYRKECDAYYAQILYDMLISMQLKVFFTKNSRDFYCENLMKCRFCVCIISPEAINNFSKLSLNSHCDDLYLEYRLALELKTLNCIENIFPIMIGDSHQEKSSEGYFITMYGNFFSSTYSLAAGISVCSVEIELLSQMKNNNLKFSSVKEKTVFSAFSEILSTSGAFIEGEIEQAFYNATKKLAEILFDSSALTDLNSNSEDIIVNNYELNNYNENGNLKVKLQQVENENRILKEYLLTLEDEIIELKKRLKIDDINVLTTIPSNRSHTNNTKIITKIAHHNALQPSLCSSSSSASIISSVTNSSYNNCHIWEKENWICPVGIVKTGMLMKKNRGRKLFGTIFRNWRERQFTLYSTGVLEYAAITGSCEMNDENNEVNKEIKGSVNVENIKIHSLHTSEADEKPFAFCCLLKNSEKLIICASSNAEMKEWVEFLFYIGNLTNKVLLENFTFTTKCQMN